MTSDPDILALIARDSDAGYRELLRKYSAGVYGHIRRITVVHADAEDALQETFVRVFRHIDRVRPGEPLAPWIYRIATNEALRQCERRGPITLSLDDCTVSDSHGPVADEYIDFSDLEAVRLQQAIQSLPPRQQATFNLRYYDDFDYATIASIMGGTAAAAKANYYNAKEKIIKYLNIDR